MDSWLRAAISLQEMEEAAKASTVTSSRMKTSFTSTLEEVFFQWPTPVQVRTALNSSFASRILHTLMANTSCLDRLPKVWKHLTRWKQSDQDPVRPRKMLSVLIADSSDERSSRNRLDSQSKTSRKDETRHADVSKISWLMLISVQLLDLDSTKLQSYLL